MERHTDAITECVRSSTVAACHSMDALLDWDEYNRVDAESLPEVA